MKILKIKTNSQLEKSLGIVFDLALKSAGIQTLEHVNFILNSFENPPEQPVVEPQIESVVGLVTSFDENLLGNGTEIEPQS